MMRWLWRHDRIRWCVGAALVGGLHYGTYRSLGWVLFGVVVFHGGWLIGAAERRAERGP